MKVFEFAKEIGIPPLALMDKIRSWEMPIRSHMSDLSEEQILEIKKKLGLITSDPVTVEGERKTKKTSTRKKKGESAPPVVIKAGKSRDQEEGARVEAEATKTVRVVRRKSREETSKPEMEKEKVVGGWSEPPQDRAFGEVVRETSDVSATSIEKPTEELVTSTDKNDFGTQINESVSAAIQEPSSEKKELGPGEVTGQTEEGDHLVQRFQESTLTLKRKEVSIGQSGVSSQPSQAATQVRRNIVGRMDLSRVQSLATSSLRPSGPSERRPAPSGFKTKTNLRAGFVVATAFNQETKSFDEEEERRREERRREKVARETIASKEAEEPPQFDASEFKKRELVFQPKKKTNLLGRPAQKTLITVAAQHKRILKVPGSMKVSDAAHEMGIRLAELTKVLMKNGVMATPAMELDFETFALVLPELGWEAQNVAKTPEELLEEMAFGDLDAAPVPRPPVVTIMGHVDHGKTSLLDAIRKTNVAAKEAGGITQHIGAYQVSLSDGYRITFLDTPGHEAFTGMRARGANVTDVVVIVVAADDGVMPQTIEAISHARAAKVPIIVALNKIDKPEANPQKVMQQLTEYELVPEEWGGETIFVPVSALTGQGLDRLLEQIRLVAELAELKANPKRSATGVVLEARLDKGRGPVATLLVRDGTIHLGEWIVAGLQKGRVRSLLNERGEKLQEAGPGTPVELLGLDGVPQPGDRFDVVEEEKDMDQVVDLRERIAKDQALKRSQNRLEDLFAKMKAGAKELPVVLKADVNGSLEAISGMLTKLGNQEVKVKIIYQAVGGITESDVLLASSSQAIVIGFNVRPDGKALQAAKTNQVDIRTYSIVYELMDDLKKALVGLLQPKVVETVLGRAEVRNTFTVSKVGTVAGCYVMDGKLVRGSQVRLIRDGKIVYDGKMSSLKRFKDDAREVLAGFECGLGIENFNDIKVGDVIECYHKEEVSRSVEEIEQKAPPTAP